MKNKDEEKEETDSLEEEIDINPTISLMLSKDNDNKSRHYPH